MFLFQHMIDRVSGWVSQHFELPLPERKQQDLGGVRELSQVHRQSLVAACGRGGSETTAWAIGIQSRFQIGDVRKYRGEVNSSRYHPFVG